MIYKFTKRAEKALDEANKIAINLGHNYIGTEHLLYGLVKEGAGIASKVLESQGVTPEKVAKEIEILIGVNQNNLEIIDNSNDFVNGFKVVQTSNGEYAYVRQSDFQLLPFRYDVASDFNEYGFAMVGKKGVFLG